MNEAWRIRLRKSRESNGLSLRAAAKLLETTPQTLISYEKPETNVFPKLDSLLRMCELYKVSVNYIIYGNNEGVCLDKNIQKIMSAFIVLLLSDDAKYNNVTKSLSINNPEIISYLDIVSEYINNRSEINAQTIIVLIEMINKLKQWHHKINRI